ncbi:MAG: DIP1984 family protein [Ktedonobacterales bacterium]|nr:DIP1984 family protein [Ktedonobacterales bacterium]
MKLAEALVRRADLQKRIEQLRERLRLSALVQEGEQPPENPQELLAELERLLSELGSLIARINRTNLATRLTDGMTLTDALAQRDTLSLHQSIIKTTAEAASVRVDRYTHSEIRRVATVGVAALRRQGDDLARQRRELDTAIQSSNWSTELAE